MNLEIVMLILILFSTFPSSLTIPALSKIQVRIYFYSQGNVTTFVPHFSKDPLYLQSSCEQISLSVYSSSSLYYRVLPITALVYAALLHGDKRAGSTTSSKVSPCTRACRRIFCILYTIVCAKSVYVHSRCSSFSC